MTISQLEKLLKKIREEHGDIRVTIDSMSHTFPPDLAVRNAGKEKVLVLNS